MHIEPKYTIQEAQAILRLLKAKQDEQKATPSEKNALIKTALAVNEARGD